MHDVKRWKSKMHSLKQAAEELLEWLYMKS